MPSTIPMSNLCTLLCLEISFSMLPETSQAIIVDDPLNLGKLSTLYPTAVSITSMMSLVYMLPTAVNELSLALCSSLYALKNRNGNCFEYLTAFWSEIILHSSSTSSLVTSEDCRQFLKFLRI